MDDNQTVTTNTMTPDARHLVRAGLGRMARDYAKAAKKAADDLDTEVESLMKKREMYSRAVAIEFADPGSAEEAEKQQSELFGDENPFRKDLNDRKGRP